MFFFWTLQSPIPFVAKNVTADVIATCTYAYEVMACINTQSKIVSIFWWRNPRASIKPYRSSIYPFFSEVCCREKCRQTGTENTEELGSAKTTFHYTIIFLLYLQIRCYFVLFHCYNKYNYSLRFSVVIHSSSLASVTLGGHARRIPNDVFRFPRSGESLTRLFLSERRQRWRQRRRQQQQKRVWCIKLGRIFRGKRNPEILARIFLSNRVYL